MTSEKKKEYIRKWQLENKEKVRSYQRNYYENNKEKYYDYYQNNREKILARCKERGKENKERIKKYCRDNRENILLNSLRSRSARLGLPFDLTLEDIQNSGVCPILGVTMERGKSNDKGIWTSPSVDRIVPELGYTKGNVQVISYKANTMKSNATPEELRMFAKWVLKTFPEEPDVQT